MERSPTCLDYWHISVYDCSTVYHSREFNDLWRFKAGDFFGVLLYINNVGALYRMNCLCSINTHAFHKVKAVVAGATVVINSITYQSATVSTYSGALGSGNGIVTGTASTYNVYAFGNISTAGTYVINYTCNTACTIYVLAVGGGGGGTKYNGGGGGGGGVTMLPVTLPIGTGTVNISVGAGGSGTSSTGSMGTNGGNTSVIFGGISITANGGGRGAGSTLTSPANNANTGGSGGGGQGVGCGNGALASGNTTNSDFANSGAPSVSPGYGGGGGGAGASAILMAGGNGIQTLSSLLGIYNFTPSGTSYGTYYWGGGGGGGGGDTTATGGQGGGAGGSGYLCTCTGGTGGISGGGNGVSNTAGNGGANTGGGGGGCVNGANSSGGGGSGIVVIAFPQ